MTEAKRTAADAFIEAVIEASRAGIELPEMLYVVNQIAARQRRRELEAAR